MTSSPVDQLGEFSLLVSASLLQDSTICSSGVGARSAERSECTSECDVDRQLRPVLQREPGWRMPPMGLGFGGGGSTSSPNSNRPIFWKMTKKERTREKKKVTPNQLLVGGGGGG